MPAKKATSTIPIVFFTAADPVEAGFVTSLNRPGGNLTGISGLQSELGPKRLELLHELVPKATTIALLVDPNNVDVEKLTRDVEGGARSLGLEIHVLRASTERDLNGVFARLADTPSRPLVIAPDAFFVSQTETLARLGLQYAVPTIFQLREFAAAGGLMSYGSNPKDSFRPSRYLCSSYSQGRKTCRPACATTNEIRVGHQFEDGKCARYHAATDTRHPRRRSDRIAMLFAALHMSAYGTKWPFYACPRMSVLGGKAVVQPTLPQ
jgi:hypothetical protein